MTLPLPCAFYDLVHSLPCAAGWLCRCLRRPGHSLVCQLRTRWGLICQLWTWWGCCYTICNRVQVFAEDKVEYVYQPLGIIVAETPALAAQAASLVAVQYSHSAVSLMC